MRIRGNTLRRMLAALPLLLFVLPFATLASAPPAKTILVLGDSLSAAYGIQVDEGWVALLRQRLPDHDIVNASISGETTDGGVSRLPALLKQHNPDIVIVELGGNDGLRGFQIDRIRDNLNALVQMSQGAGARVLLIGMKIPPNYGLRYTSEFYESYSRTAKRFDTELLPFLLEGVATQLDLMQDDGIHPNAKAQPKLLENVWPHLQPLVTP